MKMVCALNFSLFFIMKCAELNVSNTILGLSGHSLHPSTKQSTTNTIAHGGHLLEEGVAYYIPLSELEEATKDFTKKIGKGSFGSVYYGKMKDGKEVAVKTMGDSSSQLNKQFVTEVEFIPFSYVLYLFTW